VKKTGALADSGFRQFARTRSSRFGFRLLQSTGVAGADDLSADTPVSVFHFVDLHERIRTECFAFDRNECVSDFLDQLFLLRRREHVLDYFNVYEWHFVSF
jgi:hypothetical protein